MQSHEFAIDLPLNEKIFESFVWMIQIMTQTSIKIREDQIKKFANTLSDLGGESENTKSEHEAFRFKFEDFLIIGYYSGKIVFPQNSKLRDLITNALRKSTANTIDYNIIIGSDEAGKGEWLGPLIVAAVALSPDKIIFLQANGIMDSKELPITKIRDFSELIKGNSETHKIVTISPSKFNELFATFKKEGKSLNDMLAWAHARTIKDILKELGSKQRIKIIIDEFDRMKTEKRLINVLSKENITVIQKPKAEEEIAVAAASILARSARERWLDQTSKSIGINLRTLSIQEIKRDEQIKKFVKTSYLA